MWQLPRREPATAMITTPLTSAIDLASQNGVRFANESAD